MIHHGHPTANSELNFLELTAIDGAASMLPVDPRGQLRVHERERQRQQRTAA